MNHHERRNPRDQPADYPRRISTGAGTRGKQVVWEIAPGHILLTFTRAATAADIERVTTRLGGKRVSVPPQLRQTAVDPLSRANLCWLYVADLDVPGMELSALFKRLDTLLETFAEVRVAAPIYRAEGTAVEETAAAPVHERIVVHLRNDRADNVRRTVNERRFTIRDITLGPLTNEDADRLGQRIGVGDNVGLRARLPTTLLVTAPDARLTNTGFDMLVELDRFEDEIAAIELDWRSLSTWLQSGSGSSTQPPGWNLDAIHAADAWAMTQGDPAVAVALLDSSFDLEHPDLMDNYATVPMHFNAEVWALTGGSPGGAPYDVSANAIGADGHGTATTGIVGASHLVGTEVLGIADGCTIMPIALGLVPTSVEVAGGLLWAAAQGARVANLSLQTVGLAYTIQAIDLAWQAGMVLCAAAGNRGGAASSLPLPFPAWHPNVIAVGAAADPDGLRKAPLTPGDWGSQFGADLDVIAPGINCMTTDVSGAGGFDPAADFINDAQATSIATPHVSGLAALLFSANPMRTNALVRSAIERSARLFPGYATGAQARGSPPQVWHHEVGYGLIDCAAALLEAARLDTEGNMPEGDGSSSSMTDAEIAAVEAFVATVQGSNARCLHGFLFQPRAGHTAAAGPPSGGRLYLSPDLNEWVDIPQGGIVRLHLYAQDETPNKGVVLWVEDGVQLEHVRRRGVADFLSGSIAEQSSGSLGAVDLLTDLLAQLSDGASTSGYSSVRGPCRGYSSVRGPCRSFASVRGPC